MYPENPELMDPSNRRLYMNNMVYDILWAISYPTQLGLELATCSIPILIFYLNILYNYYILLSKIHICYNSPLPMYVIRYVTVRFGTSFFYIFVSRLFNDSQIKNKII